LVGVPIVAGAVWLTPPPGARYDDAAVARRIEVYTDDQLDPVDEAVFHMSGGWDVWDTCGA
jgi:hypothetical protein